MNETPSGRSSVNAHTTPFLPYDMEGPVQPEMSWLPVSYDSTTGQGTYLMRMQPGAVTIPHDHAGMEEFLILEGDLVDSDGTRFGPGDFVTYQAGTHHNSWTENGCLIAVSSGDVGSELYEASFMTSCTSGFAPRGHLFAR